MGTRGPAPKRADQRRRQNKPDGPDAVKIDGGAVTVPPLGIDGVSQVVADWYAALADGPEARFYTPATWQRARIVAHLLDGLLKSARPSAQMWAAIQADMRALLVDAGELRRLRIEVQPAEPKGAADGSNVIDWGAYHAPSR